MATADRTLDVNVPWQTILRLLIAGALVWCVLRLTTFLQLALITTVLAVTLDAPVQWLEERRVPRWAGACLIVFGLAGILRHLRVPAVAMALTVSPAATIGVALGCDAGASLCRRIPGRGADLAA